MFTQFFFLTGLAAVAFFFLGVVLLGMSLFAESAALRRRLTRAQTLALLLLLAVSGWTAYRLAWDLLPWTWSDPPTSASALLEAERESMTVMLLGLSLVVNSLLTAFAWIRIALPGNALRALVWALPGLQLVLACKDLLGALQGAGDEAFPETFAHAIRAGEVSAGVAAGVVILSWPAGWLLRRKLAAQPDDRPA